MGGTLVERNWQVCKVCQRAALQEIDGYRSLPRVTSDCMPFRAGGRLLICSHCQAVQAAADDQWFEEIREIYQHYCAYHQAGGVEQAVRDASSGELCRRSDLLLAHLAGLPGMPASGRILDVGCGTGATLRAFAKRGGWRLYGLELDEKNLSRLEQIDGFDTLYTCSLAELPGEFDVITMVHALEHFPEPLTVLRDLVEKLAPGGRLFVEVPNCEANPFDYVIADHAMHFTPATLSRLATRAGFEVNCLSTTWIAKELSLAAQPVANGAPKIESLADSNPGEHVAAQIDWLHRLINSASNAMTASARFGLFGTSIAATWLCSILGEGVTFFVEEDRTRIGRLHLGRPILSPMEVSPGSVVFIALIPQIAAQVKARLSNTQRDFRLPPPYPFTDSDVNKAAATQI